MGQRISASTGRPYGIQRVCQLWDQPRSTYYARQVRAQRPPCLRPAAGRSPPWPMTPCSP
jgi:hypothetical protein